MSAETVYPLHHDALTLTARARPSDHRRIGPRARCARPRRTGLERSVCLPSSACGLSPRPRAACTSDRHRRGRTLLLRVSGSSRTSRRLRPMSLAASAFGKARKTWARRRPNGIFRPCRDCNTSDASFGTPRCRNPRDDRGNRPERGVGAPTRGSHARCRKQRRKFVLSSPLLSGNILRQSRWHPRAPWVSRGEGHRRHGR